MTTIVTQWIFSRWEVNYTADELSAIVKERSGIDFGEILELRPLAAWHFRQDIPS